MACATPEGRGSRNFRVEELPPERHVSPEYRVLVPCRGSPIRSTCRHAGAREMTCCRVLLQIAAWHAQEPRISREWATWHGHGWNFHREKVDRWCPPPRWMKLSGLIARVCTQGNPDTCVTCLLKIRARVKTIKISFVVENVSESGYLENESLVYTWWNIFFSFFFYDGEFFVVFSLSLSLSLSFYDQFDDYVEHALEIHALTPYQCEFKKMYVYWSRLTLTSSSSQLFTDILQIRSPRNLLSKVSYFDLRLNRCTSARDATNPRVQPILAPLEEFL